MRVIDHLHHAQNVFFINDDSRKTEDTPCRVVRVNGHSNVVLVADRHDAFEEVFEVGKQFLIIHIAVSVKELFHFCHALRLPARKNCAVCITCDRFKHFFRNKCVYGGLFVGKYGRAVRTDACEFCSGPVEDRHEVIADKVNVFLAEVL